MLTHDQLINIALNHNFKEMPYILKQRGPEFSTKKLTRLVHTKLNKCLHIKKHEERRIFVIPLEMFYKYRNFFDSRTDIIIDEPLYNNTNLLDYEKFVDPATGKMGETKAGKARVNQQKYRQKLLNLWNNGCSVTGFTTVSLLIASHIKPWKDSNPEERLDKFNGLLLMPTLDALFDKGFVSFDKTRKIMISPSINPKDYAVLGIDADVKLRSYSPHHEDAAHHSKLDAFMEWHRTRVFLRQTEI